MMLMLWGCAFFASRRMLFNFGAWLGSLEAHLHSASQPNPALPLERVSEPVSAG